MKCTHVIVYDTLDPNYYMLMPQNSPKIGGAFRALYVCTVIT